MGPGGFSRALSSRHGPATSESSPPPPRARPFATPHALRRGRAIHGPHDHPEVSMHTHSLAEYMKCIDRGDWPGVGDLMLSSAGKLAKAGAGFLICPDNTIHQAPRLRHAALAPALAAHRRSGGRARRRARLPAPRPHRDALAGRERGLSGKARGSRARAHDAGRRRTRGNQPHHHGRAGLRRLQARGGYPRSRPSSRG